MISIESAVAEFILSCEADGLAAATVRWYRSLLGRFADRFKVVPAHQMTPHEVRQYLVALRNLEYSPDTVDDVTRALHRFWKWAAVEYEIKNPMRSIRYPPQPKSKKTKAVSLDTVIAMFQAADSGMNPIRDRAIIAFALDTGCRAGGICTVQAADVDISKRKAIVTEKGNKTRSVPFTKVTAALLQDWLDARAPAEVLFYSSDTWEALRPNSLYLLFKRIARRAGVKGRFNPHGFRHLFGKEYIKAGGDIVTLARIMGHDSVDTTADHYAIFTNDEIAEAHERFSPIKLMFQEDQNAEFDNE